MSTAIHNLNADLEQVSRWCCQNSLLINPDKTKVLMIGMPQLLNKLPTASFRKLGKEITPSTVAKDLGIYIDQSLTYNEHIAARWCVEEVSAVYQENLKAVLQNRIVAREVLKSARVEAEGMLNSRPITQTTQVSSDAGDIEALPSNHFLLLPANSSYDGADDNERDQLNETMATVPSARVNFFWKRFAKEYIPSLIEGKKWEEKRKNLKEADVVFVAEPDQPRGIWPLGRMGLLILDKMEWFKQSQCALNTGSTKDQSHNCVS